MVIHAVPKPRLWLSQLLLSAVLAACGGGTEQEVPQADASPTAQLMAAALPIHDAYALEVQAMQDVQKNTDVYFTLKPNETSTGPANAIKHVQMKSFDLSGALRWTKNEMNVTTDVDAATRQSTASRTYTDMLRYQPVQVQVNVQTAQTQSTQVVKTAAPVLYRPDLTISEINVPAQVRVGQVFNITATLRELNADLGATTQVRLTQDSTQLDEAADVRVDKNGITQAVLTTKFDQVGEFTLKVSAEGTKPRDYDTSNNSKTVTVKVVADVEPARYWLRYDYFNGSSGGTWNDWWGNGEYRFAGEYQGLKQTLYTREPTGQLTFPIVKTTVRISADRGQSVMEKEFTNLAARSTWSWSCYNVTRGSSRVDGVNLYVQTGNYCGQLFTHVDVSQYAADSVYYSTYHDYYWGDYSDVNAVKYGSVIRAKESVETRIVATGSNGVSLGGTARVALTQTPHEDSGSDSDSRSSSSWWYKYVWTSGYSYGVTQP